jgi:hypothetical protein
MAQLSAALMNEVCAALRFSFGGWPTFAVLAKVGLE